MTYRGQAGSNEVAYKDNNPERVGPDTARFGLPAPASSIMPRASFRISSSPSRPRRTFNTKSAVLMMRRSRIADANNYF
jgi:hypothetical protein